MRWRENIAGVFMTRLKFSGCLVALAIAASGCSQMRQDSASQEAENQADVVAQQGANEASKQDALQMQTAGHANPNNTAINKRDRSQDAITPLDQSAKESDRKITQLIRRTLVEDNSLSTDAKNIKIITINGKVTLRGPVRSDREKMQIADKTRQVQGVAVIDNQLEVETRTTNDF
jgi:hyperosmotically inducible protein